MKVVNRKKFASIVGIIVSALFVILHFFKVEVLELKHSIPLVGLIAAVLFVFAIAWVGAWMFALIYNHFINSRNRKQIK